MGEESNVYQTVPILVYHRVHADDDPSMPAVQTGTYCGHVTRSHFERQMLYLAEHKRAVITHDELVSWLVYDRPIPERSALIDFDDNRLNVFENAYPILERLGWRATVFTVSDWADGKGPRGGAEYPMMSWRELERLANAGWLIGAHTRSHPWLDELIEEPNGPEKVEAELAWCQVDLKNHLGLEAKNFAYPSGRSNPEVETIVARHFESARLWNPGEPFSYNSRVTSPYRLEANNISELTSEDAFRRIIQRLTE